MTVHANIVFFYKIEIELSGKCIVLYIFAIHVIIHKVGTSINAKIVCQNDATILTISGFMLKV